MIEGKYNNNNNNNKYFKKKLHRVLNIGEC